MLLSGMVKGKVGGLAYKLETVGYLRAIDGSALKFLAKVYCSNMSKDRSGGKVKLEAAT